MKGPKNQVHIGVLMGGVSAEQEISLRTGEAIMKALRARGYDVRPIDVGYAIAERLIAEQIGIEAYNALGCEGCARVDMMADERGEVFVLEVNTMPGMEETSLVPKAAHFAEIDFPELVERILKGASLKTRVQES